MKASAYLSIFDDWELLAPAIATIAPYVDEIIVVDGAYIWLAGFIARTGRDPSRSVDAVYDALRPFEAKLRYINGTWANELEKRMAGYAACRNRYIYRVDADEILFIDETHLAQFIASDYVVAEMEMPIYVAPGLIRAVSADSRIERQALLFDSDAITARDHLDYLWLVLSQSEDSSRQGPDAAKIYPDPIAFNAHLTHWRPPASAINRARFYVINYIRSTGDLLWLSSYRQSPDDSWEDLFARIDTQMVNDLLLGHAIVAEPPDLTGFILRPSPLSAEQERQFNHLYTNMLDGLAATNEDLAHHHRTLASGNHYSIDLSTPRAREAFMTDGKFIIQLQKPVAAAVASVIALNPATVTIEQPVEVEIAGKSLTLDLHLPAELLRQTLRFSVWNADGSTFNEFFVFGN